MQLKLDNLILLEYFKNKFHLKSITYDFLDIFYKKVVDKMFLCIKIAK